MPCVTYSVALHVYLRRSQILLTFNILQVMYSIFYIVLSIKVAYKGLCLMQQHNKEQDQALVSDHSQHSFGLMFHFKL